MIPQDSNDFNGISTDPDLYFSNTIHFENVDNPGVEVDENALPPGTYRVFSTDSNGCDSNEHEFTIYEPDPLTMSLFYNYNGDGSLEPIANGGVIEILCHDDFVHIATSPNGGTIIDIDSYDITWNATEMSSGVYFITAKVAGITETQKVMLIK